MSSVGDRFRSAGESIADPNRELPGWLVKLGTGGWLVLGIAGTFALMSWLFVYSASISIPLLLAIVIGMIAYPLCERMMRYRVPKTAAAGVVLLLLVVIIGGVIWLVFAGVLSQWPAITQQIEQGITELAVELEAAGFDTEAILASFDSATASANMSVTRGALSSVGSMVAEGLAGVLDLIFGLFIGATLLFYVLTDFPTISDWISAHMGGLPRDVSDGIIEDAVSAMRGYFRGTTITGVTVAAVIAIAMMLLGVPLSVTVGVVTFLTCYIPFFGAIISGAFAFIVALGSAGLPTAILLLVIVLLAQNLLQTVISARVMGESLNLHPLVVLVVTMLGGIFGGLLGAALGAPLAALLVNAGKRLSRALKPGAVEGELGISAVALAQEAGQA